jgi:hypothetical protein
MSRELALVVMIAVTVALIGVLAWAWWRRTRRDAALPAPFGEVPEGSQVLSTSDALYVATTRHDEPLERLAMRGLAFRSRVTLTVTSTGLALDLTGQPRMFLPRNRIDDVSQATVAIDRVVEKDGLVRVAWHLQDGTVVDSYLRAQNASARSLAEAIGILTASTGTDA